MDSSIQAIGNLATMQATQPVAPKRNQRSDAEFERTAKEFESVFMAQMLQPMFAEIEVDGMFGGGQGEEMVRGLLVQEYGKAMVESGSVGLTNSIKAELIRLQEVADSNATGTK